MAARAEDRVCNPKRPTWISTSTAPLPLMATTYFSEDDDMMEKSIIFDEKRSIRLMNQSRKRRGVNQSINKNESHGGWAVVVGDVEDRLPL
jgi:hypothetical protein